MFSRFETTCGLPQTGNLCFDPNMSESKKIIIYTDGACSGNPGPGGWASIVLFPTTHVQELGGAEIKTTNNRMELMAVLRALDLVISCTEDIHIYTDSVYVIRGATQWCYGWSRRGWKTSQGEDVLNQDLWQQMMALTRQKKNIHWHYCRGHQGTPGNERCDELSVEFSQGHSPRLYRGPLSQYSVAILPLPDHQELPEMKGPSDKAKAIGYLSLINGVVTRHKTWAECEAQVKGRSGAKFKKIMNSDEQSAVLSAWGLDPQKITVVES